MGVGVLGHGHEAGGAPVQAVDGVEGSNEILRRIMGHEKVGQRVPVVAETGVDGQVAGLVDDEQVFVLIADGQRARDGGDLITASHVPNSHGKDLPRLDEDIGKDGLAVQQNAGGPVLGPPDTGGGKTQLPAEQGADLAARQGFGNG